MKSSHKKVTILAAMHGDEVYGIELFKAFVDKYPYLMDYVSLVIGNKKAVAAHTRFIDTDMNRSFGLEANNTETREITRIKRELVAIAPDFIVDVHTTRRDSGIFFITDKMSGVKKELCAFLPYDVCVMKDPVISRSFIGNNEQAVSLEYSLSSVTPRTTDQFVNSLKLLIVGEKSHQIAQSVYDVRRLITKKEYFSYPSLRNYDEKSEGIALMVPADETEMDAEYFGFWCTKVN